MNIQRKTIDFINATCASRTKKLVGADRLRRMAEAESLAQAFDILRESHFGGEENFSCGEYEKLIEAEELLLCSFVKDFAPSNEILQICLIDNDFYNVQALLKCEFMNLPCDNYLQTAGVFTVEELKDLLKGENLSNFPKELVKAVNDARESFKNGNGGMAIGAIFTRAKFAYLTRVTKTDYLKKLLVKKIDGINLCVCLRAGDSQIANGQILKGGTLNQKQIDALASHDRDSVINLFEGHWIKDFALLGVDAVANGKPIVDLERQLSSLEAQRMIDGRYVEQSGTYPFMLYYFKRKNEIACVRTILTGKANGLDGEQIKRRLITV